MLSVIGTIILLSAVVWLTFDLLDFRLRKHGVWTRRAAIVAVLPFASLCSVALAFWAVYRDRDWGSFKWELRDFYDSVATAWARELT